MFRILFLSLMFLILAGGVGSSGGVKLTPAELETRLKEAGEDPLKLLPLARSAEENRASDIRKQVHKLLVDQGQQMTAAEKRQFAQELARLLPAAVHAPQEVAEVLGLNKKVSRQILHRRYLEQWVYEKPVPLIVTFNHPKGQSAQLLSVLAAKVTQP